VSTEMKVADAIADSSFMVHVETHDATKNKEIVRDCPAGKEFNPLTKRCVNVCAPGKVRNPDFKCAKEKIIIDKVCPDGKELNPITKRCVKAKNIANKGCPDGKEVNPTTKRCVKTCKVGHVRNADFKCVREAIRGTRKVKSRSMKAKSPDAFNLFSRDA